MTKLQEVIDTYQELQRMHKLNIEMLEQLAVACDYLVTNQIQLPNASTFASLLSKAMVLMDEIQADEPKILQYTTNRRKFTAPFHGNKTDEDVTEPNASAYKGMVLYTHAVYK